MSEKFRTGMVREVCYDQICLGQVWSEKLRRGMVRKV